MKILVAADDPICRCLLRTMLVKWEYEVLQARDGTEAWQALQSEDPPQLAILDWMMPGIDGIQVCRQIRQQEGGAYTYVILLTAKGQKEDLIHGLEAGADDYLTKPFDAQELKVRLHTGRRILDLQGKLLNAHEALHYRSTHDSLTGLWNRSAILDTLGTEWERSRREGTHLSIAMVDLDHFKRVNDTHGHLAGDAVLSRVAQTMQGMMRPYDAVGRYGGEEFLIVLPGCDDLNALRVADRLCSRIAGEAISLSEGSVYITASAGVAATGVEIATDVGNLIRLADAALYRAKDSGRNRVQLATEVEATCSTR
jgi:two-component system cell cycle response regulator